MKFLIKILVMFSLISQSSNMIADQVNALRFKPAISSDSYYIESGTDSYRGFGREYKGIFTLNYETVDNAITVVESGGQETVSELVKNMQRARATLAYQIFDRVVIGITIPMDNVNSLQPFDTMGENKIKDLNYKESGWELGDIHLTTKVSLFDEKHPWNWTLLGSIVAPTGNEQAFSSDDSIGFGLGVGFTKYLNASWKVYGNLGYFYAKNSKFVINDTFRTFDATQRAIIGGGINYRMFEWMSAYLESGTQVGLPFNDFQNPFAMNIGTNFYWNRFILTAGYGLEEFFDRDHSQNRFYVGMKVQFAKKNWDAESAMANLKEQDKAVASNREMKELTSTYIQTPKSQSNFGHNGVFAGDRNIYFSTGRSNIIPVFNAKLDQIAQHLKLNTGSPIRIVGHADGRGNPAKNHSLSKDRANSVKNYFVNQHGIDSSRIQVESKSSSAPVAEEVDSYSRTLNRRVEVEF